MSTRTTNLELFKYNVTADASVAFSIEDALNQNWDILDEKYQELRDDLDYVKAGGNINQYITGDKTTITIKAGTVLSLDTNYYTWETDTNYTVSDLLDTGSITAGKDYCIYLVTGGNLKVSLNSTYPSGYNTTTSKKIGGFHTLCVAVTSSNAPTLPSNTFWETHPAIGYNAGDIIPNSVWTLAHRPFADPNGMVFIDGSLYGDKPFWVDIYLQSGTLTSTESAYGGTLTNSRMSIMHTWDMLLNNKILATDQQFLIFAEGSNQKTSITGSKLPSPTTTGGHVDTASKRMISGFFVEECCGYVWQWLNEIGPAGGSGWNAYTDTSRGGDYGSQMVLFAGGRYDNSTNCGSWSRNSNNSRRNVNANNGARGVIFHNIRCG